MFKKYYKEANDDIKTNRELIGKIFDAAEKPSIARKKTKIYRFSTVIAAVFVFAAAAFMYPQLQKLNEQPQISVQYEQTPKTENIVDTKSQQKITENKVQEQKPVPQTQNEKTETIFGITQPETVSEDSVVNGGISVANETEGGQGFENFDQYTGRMKAVPDAVNERTAALESLTETTVEETSDIDAFLKENFGEVDSQSGNVFVFEIVGRTDEIIVGRWRWLLDGHSSLITEFVLSTDFAEMYECVRTDDGMVKWNTSNNLLKK